MGLIKAAMGAAGGVMADQWKEFFYCDALNQDTLMIKGQKRTGARSSNTKGSDNIISNGSGIAVANGQCMMIVEQGKVVEVCAEPGEYTYDTSSEPSIFAGNLSDSIKSTFMTIGKRFTYGGDTGKDQRVYYFNTKEITDNKFGTKGSDNIISNGSGIAVANGQCMMIVEQGKVVEVCAEPGEYTYDTSSEPSIFAGNLSDSIKSTFMTIGKRFTYGGDTGKDQRVYYFNTKEITDNKFGTANPVWFRVVDQKINLDKDVEIRCNGIYSYRITNPLLFYTNLGGNVSDRFERSEIDTQLRTEFINALQPAFAKIAELEIRPSQIPAHSMEIGDAMNEVLTKKWSELRGISIVSVAFNPVTLKEEDAEAIKQAQNASMYRDPNMMAATLGMAQAEAMKTAAGNPNGAMMGFMGMNMAGGGMGGMNLQGLYNQGAAQQQMQQQQMQEQQMREQQMQQQQIKQQKMAQNTQTTETAAGWTCACGKVNTGKFCIECGKPKPADGWTCSCGTVNKGKFCMECGKPKPAGEPLYRCDKCGWEPEDPKNPPRFCPECGDPFDENNMQ